MSVIVSEIELKRMATTTNASRSRAWMVDVMRPYLVDRLNSTEEEIEVLKHLYSLKSTSNNMRGPRKPSTIIDNFLYHGDFGHAQNKLLLDELGIKHIINVSDQQLNKDIHRDYRVTWINIGDTMDTNISQYFDSINEILYKCANDQEKVLVNCQMGISRSSTIVLSYLLT